MIRAPLLASTVAEHLGSVPDPWDVYAERARRYEIQLRGTQFETVRGPLHLEGYGVRVLRSIDGQTGVGFQASSDFEPASIRACVGAARDVASFNRFPAHHPELPERGGRAPPNPAILDADLWTDPLGALHQEATAILAAADSQRLAPPTFVTLRATLIESSIANSRGLATAYAHTAIEREVAVKSEGGPEGRPPGEYWFDEITRQTRRAGWETEMRDWHRFATDARRASPPPTGEYPVVLPSGVLSGILPPVLGFQFSAASALRGLGVPTGTVVGGDALDVTDDGSVDWALGSAPVDDEGTPQGTRPLIVAGRASAMVSDVLHANALSGTPTGNAIREGFELVANYWQKFTRTPSPATTTLVVRPGNGGSDEELLDQVDEGVWVQKLGWAIPDPVAATFGGEIRIGYRIHHGKLGEPVRGGTVGGPVMTRDGRPSMLNGVVAMGSRATRSVNLLCPTLAVRNLLVSGEELTDGSASG